jgi:hypothetical protein
MRIPVLPPRYFRAAVALLTIAAIILILAGYYWCVMVAVVGGLIAGAIHLLIRAVSDRPKRPHSN